MDNYLILEFTAWTAAEVALEAVNALAASRWVGQGYTVENDILVGRNAATGEDAPDKQRTTTWAIIAESPDETFYFSSPSNDPRFTGWQDDLPEGVNTGTEKTVPATWAPSGEEI